MQERTIYLLFTDTGTYLAKAINFCTRQSLNHVSISLDGELRQVYSFGRKRPRNPFIGGFVEEDVTSDFLRNSQCAVYSCSISAEECEQIMENIKEIEAKKDNYRYNFIGLFGVLFHIKINRKNALFCSQFVATVLEGVNTIQVKKPSHFIRPGDLRTLEGMQLIYQGKLEHYPRHLMRQEKTLVTGTQTEQKQSFIFLLSSKVKRFVIR
ncbi:hypothetical protein ACTWPF_02440 [Oceanobacillus sp. M65]|uniref:Uncharacterized protein n=1 Tax=Oceanobacillus jordanicus TaxID=2867266 RepID=A0AAW5B1I6_9BACI|nr:hypothetical protein [Oceanobacillus jordanicus]AVR00653.1 hypothetical protein OBCHQ24_17100 [Oceanobacillus iheyensis]MCG3417853.1 hypothetical protein [Oceanobacillus jordanicus]